MKPHFKLPGISFLATLFCAFSVGIVLGNPLPNPGFEEGTEHWAISDGESKALPEAAKSGKLGLRVGKTDYYPSGASVFSAKFPVAAEQEVTLKFQARAKASICGAYLWPYDANNKLAGSALICPVVNSNGEWKEYSKTFKMPKSAVAVAIWIHTYAGAVGIVDFDDFVLEGLAEDAKPIPQPPVKPRKPVVNVSAKDIPARKTPPVIILKFDDLKQTGGGYVHARWRRVAEYLENKKIKGGLGMLCETLENATPRYVEWFAERRKAGYVEFWFHGWDHKTHEVDGKRYNEFSGRTYEEQHERLAKSQQLAKEKLGFSFTAFGPPGGVTAASLDENTLQVMTDDPDIITIMYPQPFDDKGRKYHDSGKLVILDRVWAVNLEGAVGVPDVQRFLNGYAKNLEREYFVLQGHPASWDDGRFAEFEKIVDFLIEQNAVFMTPTEYALKLKKQ